MLPENALRHSNGRATWAELRALGVSRGRLRGAVQRGAVARTRRGLYRLAELETQVDAAQSVAGVLSHRSAALQHGWKVATVPKFPEVVVPRNRNVTAHTRAGIDIRWRALGPEERRGVATSPVRTVLDCARDLPFAEALAVADSALRAEHYGLDGAGVHELHAAAARAPQRGSRAVTRVLTHANALADNPFESVTRALALEAGLEVEPQVQIVRPGLYATVDMADRGRRLVIEADSFAHHGHRSAFRQDVRRYSELAIHGWSILRVNWEDAMLRPDYALWLFRSWREWHDHGRKPGPPPLAPRAV